MRYAMGLINVLQRPVCSMLGPSLLCYWEVVGPLRGGAYWEVMGVCVGVIGTPASSCPSLVTAMR